MIARRWTARAEGSEQADAYVAHFEHTVRPHLESTEGFLGATIELIRDDDGSEIVVVTRWASMDAIRAFSGEDIDLAVVEPEARAVLAQFDTRVRHIELADGQAFDHLELNGDLLVDVEGAGTITLARHQACSVPRGVVHRTRAPRRTTILMVEAAGVMPVGD